MASKKKIGELFVQLSVEDKAVKQAKEEVNKLGKEGKKTEKELKGTGRAGKKAGDDTKRSADRAKRAVRAMGKAAGIAGKALKGMAVGLGVVLAGGAALVGLVTNAAGANDEMTKLAASTGVSANEMERLSFAATQSGADAQTLSKSIRFLNKGLADAKEKGTSPVYEGLTQLGLSMDQLGGSAEQNLGVLADALNNIEDPAQRATIAAKVLGEEGGPKLATMLAEGSKGIDKLGDQAKQSTDEQRQALTEFMDTMGEIANSLSQLLLDVITPLLPMIQDLALRFSEMFSQLADSGLIDKLTEAFGIVIDLAFELINEFMPAIDELIDGGFFDQMIDIMKALAPIIVDLTKIMIPLFQFTLDLLKPLNEVLLLVIKALGKVVEIVREAVDAFERWAESTEWVGKVGDKVDRFTSAMRRFGNQIAGTTEETFALKGALQDAIDLKNKLERGPVEEWSAKEKGKQALDWLGGVAAQAEAEKQGATQQAATQAAGIRNSRILELIDKSKDKPLSPAEFAQLSGYNVLSDEELAALNPANKKKKRRGGGGRKTAEKEVTSDVTLVDALTAFRQGNASAAQLAEVAKGLSTKTPEVKDIKPTIALSFYNIENNFDIDGAQSPGEVGEAIVAAIDKQMKKANALAASMMNLNIVS